jgi:hypothetical protein
MLENLEHHRIPSSRINASEIVSNGGVPIGSDR